MTKTEVQQVMAVVRPAIIAIYGRQTFRLVAYKDRLAYQGKPFRDLILNVTGDNDSKYKVEVENFRVTSLAKGEFSIS